MLDNQLNQAIEIARAAAARGDFETAISTQERVVGQIRLKAKSHDDLVTLSVQMFNLADYYTGRERFAEAITLLEQVVGFDEKLGLPDIASDLDTLNQVRKLAAMSPAERQQFYASTPASAPTVTGLPANTPDAVSQLLEQLEGIDTIDRAEVEALVRELVGLSPEEQVRRVMDKLNNQ
jgi:tetratricopeptide (TPR) repeat protein